MLMFQVGGNSNALPRFECCDWRNNF